MNARFRQLDAVLFRKSLFSDADFRVEIYSSFGYESVFAFGSAKEKSKKRSLLESGNLIRCSLVRKNKNSPSQIKELRLIWHPHQIFQGLHSASRFYFLMECLSILLQRDQEGIYYATLVAVLQKMESFPNQQALSLAFLFSLLSTEGHLPSSEQNLLPTLEDLTQTRLKLGNGSLRFIIDAEHIQNLDFWVHQILDRDVELELIFLIQRILEVRYEKKLYSVSLFRSPK